MKQRCGFTLIESLVYLAVISILLLCSLPLYFQSNQKTEVDRISEDIRQAIQFARNYAFQTGIPVELSPLAKSGDWSLGMVLKKEGKLFYQWRWQQKGIMLSWRGFSSKQHLLFSNNLRKACANGHFLLISDHYQKKLIVNRLGHVYDEPI